MRTEDFGAVPCRYSWEEHKEDGEIYQSSAKRRLESRSNQSEWVHWSIYEWKSK